MSGYNICGANDQNQSASQNSRHNMNNALTLHEGMKRGLHVARVHFEFAEPERTNGLPLRMPEFGH